MREIVIATKNQHKFDEFCRIMRDFPVICRPLSDVSSDVSYDEPYHSFLENALQKARAVSRVASLPVLSDDSGLCVDALAGKPGVFSARYTESGDDSSNRKKLLSDLHGHMHRRASFICVTVFIRCFDDPVPLVALGVWSGQIAAAERGSNGFGYDAIFQPDGYQETVGEMSCQQKEQLSHRAIALRKMREELSQWLLP